MPGLKPNTSSKYKKQHANDIIISQFMEEVNMTASLLLTKIFGFYFFIMAFVIFVRPIELQEVYKDVMQHRGTMFIFSALGLLLGLFLVLIHNIWTFDARLAITIISWWILIKSILGLFFPKSLMQIGRTVSTRNSILFSIGAIQLFLGLFLLYSAYWI